MQFFDTDSELVRQQVLLLDKGIITEDQVPPLYNLREVVSDVLSQDNRMVDIRHMEPMEGGDSRDV